MFPSCEYASSIKGSAHRCPAWRPNYGPQRWKSQINISVKAAGKEVFNRRAGCMVASNEKFACHTLLGLRCLDAAATTLPPWGPWRRAPQGVPDRNWRVRFHYARFFLLLKRVITRRGIFISSFSFDGSCGFVQIVNRLGDFIYFVFCFEREAAISILGKRRTLFEALRSASASTRAIRGHAAQPKGSYAKRYDN